MNHVDIDGYMLSQMTLGTVQLGMRYGIANKSGQPDEASCAAILQEAIDSGVTCFDTANLYGESEHILGRFFGEKTKPLFVTKLPVSTEPHLTAKEIEKQMRETVHQSLQRLQIDRIPLLLLHHSEVLLTHASTVIPILRTLQQEGLIAKAGISLDPTIEEQFERIWPSLQNDIFEAIQIPLNIFDHRLLRGDRLSRLKAAGKIVFARSVFLQGVLFLKDDELTGALTEAKQPLIILRDLAEREGMSVAQLAVTFVRDMESIHSLVIGAETAEQVRDNIKLIHGPPIAENTRAEIERLLANVPEQVVNPYYWTSQA